MKLTVRLVLVGCLMAFLVSPVAAQKGRKLPAKAYLQSAKIEILGYAESKDKSRIVLAQAMLDSLLMNYGPHSEGYYWYTQIKWDLSAEKSSLKERLPIVKEAVALADSLKWTCGNDKIDKKNREKCSEFDVQMDSIRIAQWRDYYNAGIGQMKEVEQQMEAVKVEKDSAALAYFQTRLDAITDSCQDNMAIATVIDSTDARPFVALATVNEKTGKFDKAIDYLKRAMPFAEDRSQILISIAYDYVQMNNYCDAIPWFRQWIDTMTSKPQVMQDPNNRASVISTAQNLAICYNNCKEYDSAYTLFKRVLTFDPQNVDALVGASRYQQYRGREAGDSSKASRDNSNEAGSKSWQQIRDQRFDSARVFLKQAFELAKDKPAIAAEYGLMAAILQKYDEAKIAFSRATELAPDDADHWVSLGDCDVSLKDWKGAAAAYEHVVQLRPDNKPVWERLGDLYQELGNKARREEILQKLKTM